MRFNASHDEVTLCVVAETTAATQPRKITDNMTASAQSNVMIRIVPLDFSSDARLHIAAAPAHTGM
jgi:hypothetical protein